MRFRFESLLRLRKNQENMLQREMGNINTHLVRQKDKLASLQNITAQSREEFNRRIAVNPDQNLLGVYHDFFRGSQVNNAKQAQVISEVEERADSKREELNEAVKKRRILEILEERHQFEVKREMQKREMAEMDEIASTRRMRDYL
ncbi:MAG: flagellar export protein FliJ [Candidatus Nitronauta litoralis]|uniref:Flagellar FliJ protein n=1 Tax=Candidatus Nitronauta litoralis TaxID=2705533 RepID=A0A7T0BX34_9BACT|nr:MAG: flagellar export protein FliJ [Candidatus Nitronauta litoralis]